MSIQFNQAGFIPAMWLGTYNFLVGPNLLTFDDAGTTLATHTILGARDQTEPVGEAVHKLSFQGYVMSLNNQAMLDAHNFTATSNFYNRPVGIGFFSQDNSAPNSSQVLYSNIGYVQDMHFDFKGGYGLYKYGLRFNWTEASPATVVAGGTSDGRNYTFNMQGLGTGFIGGLYLSGGLYATNGLGQFGSILDNNGNTIGSAPQLGGPPGLFTLLANPQIVSPGSGSAALMWPVKNSAQGSQSIQLSTAPTGNYKVVFQNSFLLNPAVSLLYYQM